MNKNIILWVVIAFLLGLTLGNANIYNGLNKGLSWNRGGIEILPVPGVFLCDASYNPLTRVSTHYQWFTGLNSLVAEC